jgi:hypothetical protein
MNKENYICSTFFKLKANTQSGWNFNSDDFIYMKNWYESADKFNLKCVIFYDNLSNEFIEKYKKIQFIKVDQFNLNIVDYRWVVYDEYLRNNKENINLILFTDMSDIVFLKNPFDLISTKPNTIFVGDEPTTVSDGWIKKRSVFFHNILPEIIEHEKLNGNKKLLNCGIVGGEVAIVSEFVHEMAEILSKANLELTTFDMVVLNYLIYTKYVNRFFSGTPLNTRFKGNEKNNKECYIKHK